MNQGLRFRIGVAGKILKDGKVFMMKRKFSPNKGKWALPGGRVNDDETLKEACIREVLEETGLTVEPREIVQIIHLRYVDENGRPTGWQAVTPVFLCEVVDGAIDARVWSEADEYGWFDKSPENCAYDLDTPVYIGDSPDLR